MKNPAKKPLLGIFILSCLFLGLQSRAAVWQAQQTWNTEWEQRYSAWVRSSFNEEIFVSGPYKGIATDCSDAVYYGRLIFAYENKLPFVIADPSGGSNRLSNKMSRFDSISDPLKRMRRFMVYIGAMTNTKTLPIDSYPVAIRRTQVRPGTVWTRPRRSENNFFRRIIRRGTSQAGHAETVKNLSDTGVLTLIGSTVPYTVRQLHTTTSMVYMPEGASTGLRNWLWPEQYGQSKSQIPGYSLEQFSSLGRSGERRNLNQWNRDVQKRLALREETKAESLRRLADDICGLVHDRVGLIADSEERRRELGGACMDRDDYESYSTPSRDKRIKQTVEQLMQMAGTSDESRIAPYFKSCQQIPITSGRRMALSDFVSRLMRGAVSSNPNHSFEARWGLRRSMKLCRRY